MDRATMSATPTVLLMGWGLTERPRLLRSKTGSARSSSCASPQRKRVLRRVDPLTCSWRTRRTGMPVWLGELPLAATCLSVYLSAHLPFLCRVVCMCITVGRVM
jgi:hypothetical protein